jgi:predicted phage tail protein
MSGEIIVKSIPDPRRIASKGDGKSGGGGGSQQHQPVTFPDTLRSKATARIIEVLSEGQIQGPVTPDNWWQSIYLDGTQVADDNGTMQFSIIQADSRLGTPDQEPLWGNTISEAEVIVNVQTAYNVPIVRTLSDNRQTSVRYRIRIPMLYMQEDDGDVNGTSLAYAFDVRVDGGPWINYVSENLWGKTSSPYERSVRIFLPPYTDTCDIRITRLTPDAPDKYFYQLWFAGYTEIIDGGITYDDTAVFGVTIDAEQFPSVPQRAFHIYGMLMQIPSNYDGMNHVYTGDWDGEFVEAWTNNPAWILYNCLINERWGIGRYIDAAGVDKWSFYDASIYCDGLVPDLNEGQEPRWTCNTVISTRQDAWQVLTAVASGMLSTIYFANGTIYLVQDRPWDGNPARLFGPADILEGTFDYTGTDYRSQFTAAAISWNDPSNQYEPSIEVVQDQLMVAQQGYKETQQTAFACTSRAQAQRFGRWLIYTSQFEKESVSFTTGLENADLKPGDIISISDPGRTGARLVGRLMGDDGDNTITIDQNSSQMGAGWQMMVTVGSAADGVKPRVIILTLTSYLGNEQWIVSGKTIPLPAGSMWMSWNLDVVVPTSWRVNTVSDQGEGRYQILATEFHNEKFDYVDNAITLPFPSFTLYPTGPLAPPTNIQFTEFIYLDANSIPQFGCLFSWTPSADARVSRYQIEMSGPSGDYRKYLEVVGVAQEVLAMRQGEWLFQIRAFDNIGRRSAIASITFIPIGLTAIPLAPDAVYLEPQGGNMLVISWTPTGEIDVMFYWIKWSSKQDGSALWDNSTTTIARVDRNTTQTVVPIRAGTYMVKTIDSLGQESATWVEAIMTPQQTERSIFLQFDEAPLWQGDIVDNFHHNGDELWLPPPAEPEDVDPTIFPGERGNAFNYAPVRVGDYDFYNELDLGATTLVNVSCDVEGYGILQGLVMAFWTPLAIATPIAAGSNYAMVSWRPLASAVPLAKGTSRNWDAHIDLRVSDDGENWESWNPLKSTDITGRVFQWRLHGLLYDLATTLRIVRASVTVEVPLRSVQGDDAPFDAGELTVNYVAPFLVTPTVQITARQTLSPGGTMVITESDRDHFKIEHRSATGAVVTAPASVDYFVQGYGGHA